MRRDPSPQLPRALRDLDSLVGTRTASIPHAQSRVGYARWTLVYGTPHGSSPHQQDHRKGDPLGVSALVLGPAAWMDSKRCGVQL